MRLIDADALINALKTQDYSGSPESLKDWTPQDLTEVEIADINKAPTIDAEPVIRCKDCHYCGEIDKNGWHCCENLGVGMQKNGFCSDAERKVVTTGDGRGE